MQAPTLPFIILLSQSNYLRDAFFAAKQSFNALNRSVDICFARSATCPILAFFSYQRQYVLLYVRKYVNT